MQSDEVRPIRRILLLSANPRGTSPLRLAEEHRRIKDALKQSDSRDHFDIRIETAVTVPHIRRTLLEHRPEIVHFCGHGLGPDGLVCEDELGRTKLVPTAALSNLFKLARGHVKCVILNACFAEIQANEIVRHIDFVVGMKHSIGDEAALRFAEGFYDALFAGKPFLDCYKWGVNAIQLENIPEDSTPVVKTKAPRKRNPKAGLESLINAFNNSEQGSSPPPAPNHDPREPNPIPNDSPPQIVASRMRPPLRRMSKGALLLLIPAGLYIIFVALGLTGAKQYDIAGFYIQESGPEVLDQPGLTSPSIRHDEVNTTLVVFVDPQTGKCRGIETTFLRYYYAPDPSHLEIRLSCGSSKAEYVHGESYRGGGKITMEGHPDDGQSYLQVEPLSGDKKLVDEIREAITKEIIAIKATYRLSRTEWCRDEGRNLIKKRESYGEHGELTKTNVETFIRQF